MKEKKAETKTWKKAQKIRKRKKEMFYGRTCEKLKEKSKQKSR